MGRLLSCRRGDRVGKAIGRCDRLLEAAMGPRNFWHVVVASRRRRRGVQAYQFCGHAVRLDSLLRLLWSVLTIMGNVRETELWA